MKLLKIIQSKWVYDNLLMLTIAGSRLYGTEREDSDYDVRGCCFAPLNYWIGTRNFEQLELKFDNFDIVIYNIKKLGELFIKGNPNVIEFVFSKDLIFEHDYYNKVIKNYLIGVINKNCLTTFLGYWASQLAKALNTQSVKPSRQNLVNEYGLDLKFAMHFVRVITRGCELLKTGRITLPRPDREFLKKIRNGDVFNKLNIQEFVKLAENELIPLLKSNEKGANLPNKPNYNLLDDMLKNIFLNLVLKDSNVK